jgi:hypothetical protein
MSAADVEGIDSFEFTSRMPKWAMALLKHEGIGPQFKSSRLTYAQKTAIENVEALINLHNMGLIKAHYDPKSDELPKFSLTNDGRKTAIDLKQEEETE